MRKRALVLISAILLSGCATGSIYHTNTGGFYGSGYTDGNMEYPDMYWVRFKRMPILAFKSIWNLDNETFECAQLRCAKLASDKGYRYFILTKKDMKYFYGGSGLLYIEASFELKGYKEYPHINSVVYVYDAQKLQEQLETKYQTGKGDYTKKTTAKTEKVSDPDAAILTINANDDSKDKDRDVRVIMLDDRYVNNEWTPLFGGKKLEVSPGKHIIEVAYHSSQFMGPSYVNNESKILELKAEPRHTYYIKSNYAQRGENRYWNPEIVEGAAGENAQPQNK